VVSKINGPKVYNFFSSTEEVLRAYPDDGGLVPLAEIMKNLSKYKEYLSIAVFVKQEKYKGRRSFFNPADNIGGVSSSYCGWGFGRDWNTYLDIPMPWKISPQKAAEEIPDTNAAQLQTKPFFAVDNRHLWPHPSSLLDQSLGDLISEIGSDFVNTEVRYTGLDSYYTQNAAAHDKVKVKDWLLAEAFPATTLPMGANKNIVFQDTEKQNIDMSGVKTPQGGCCKTNEDLWPKNRNGEWWHSDYKDISHPHTSEFYKKIKMLTNAQ
jgi:hypothetical protein